MESPTNSAADHRDEISLKDLILKFHEWLRFLWARKALIIISALLGGSVGLVLSFRSIPQYTAELTFVLEDGRSSQLGAYSGVASQLGIDIGTGGASGLLAGDNIMEYLRSRLLIEKTLLSSVKLHDKEITLATLFMQMYDYESKWESKPHLRKVAFPVNAPRQSFSLLQDSVLNTFHEKIIRSCLSIDKPDRKASFIAVVCKSPNEFFSKFFVEILVKEATEFYMGTKTKRSRTNVAKLQHAADSIEALLNKKTMSAALTMDLNRNPSRSVALVSSELNEREKRLLNILYGEIIKNLELAKMTMAQETPLIQIVDAPILPLKMKKLSAFKGIILGVLLGSLIVIVALVTHRLYKIIMVS